MDVQINTSNAVPGREGLLQDIEISVRDRLSRFEDKLTRIEVHVGDENSPTKGGGNDMSCVIEARPAGMAPITVTEQAGSIDQASTRALAKMATALDRAFGKLSDRKGH